MEVKTLEQIEKEIAETKAALQNVHGTETEVYARIVGYYRAVKHWNNGKRDEYNLRKMFTLEDSKCTSASEKKVSEKAKQEVKLEVKENNASFEETSTVTYEIYTRKTCPNCPPVKDYMETVDMPGRSINVDTKEGLAEAAKNGIFATPTVIFYNKAGVETARCHNVEELDAVMKKVSVLA